MKITDRAAMVKEMRMCGEIDDIKKKVRREALPNAWGANRRSSVAELARRHAAIWRDSERHALLWGYMRAVWERASQ